MNIAYLSLGSNEGNRMQWIQDAIAALQEKCGLITKKSSVYETAAWGLTTQPDFLNMVVELKTGNTAADLLKAILQIESVLGRHRDVKWGPRTIDVDILLFNEDVIDTPDLAVPHPYLHLRRFTLTPLAEIASTYVHPVLHKTVCTLLDECPDRSEVHLFKLSE